MARHPAAAVSTPRALLALALGVPLLMLAVATLFAWPVARLAPRDLPVGVAGPPPAVQQLSARFEADPGAFDVHRYADGQEARQAIEEREVYGAVVVTPRGPKLLTASAASPAVSQLLTKAATQGNHAPGDAQRVRIVDVVRTASGDPRGAILGASVFPMLLGGIVLGALTYLLGGAFYRRLLGLALGAAGAALVAIAVLQGWLDAFDGSWLANAGVVALGVFAIGSAVSGLGAVLGRAGLGLGVAAMVLLGNPASGAAAAPELLPGWFAAIGRLMPPGAGITALRNVAYFDANAITGPLTVLACWAAAGLVLLAAHAYARGRGRTVADVPEPQLTAH